MNAPPSSQSPARAAPRSSRTGGHSSISTGSTGTTGSLAVALAPPGPDALLAATLGLAKELSLDLSEEGVGARFLQTLRDLLPGRALCLRVVEGTGHDLTSLFYCDFTSAVRGGSLRAEGGGLLGLAREPEALATLQVETLRGPLLIKRAALRHTGLPEDIATSARVILTDRYVPLFRGTVPGFSVPLVAGGELCGLLNCEYPTVEVGGPRDARRDELAVIPLCNQVSVALRNLRLLQRARSLERQMLQAERLATVGQLAAGVVHELATPLSAIGIYGEALERRLRGLGDGFVGDAEKAARICEGAERITRLTRDLMNYGRTSGEEEPLELATVVRQGLMLVDPLLRQAGVKVRYHADDGLPLVSGVKKQLQQVVVNLVTNACHALQAVPRVRRGPQPRGALGSVLLDDGEIRVIVSAARVGRQPGVCLIVADSGVGIPRPLHERVFEPFFSTKTEGQGTGLGLPIVRNIVDAHGGQISFESEAGVGTVFRVMLPSNPALTLGPGYEAARLAARITLPLALPRAALDGAKPRGAPFIDEPPALAASREEELPAAQRRRKKS